MFLKDRIIQMFTNNLKISLHKPYFEIPDALKHVFAIFRLVQIHN